MLKLYSNIKRLRKLHNMSQQELAEAVGYSGKSMVAQIENGKVNLPSSMITKFAEVFHVTELELMGLDEEEPEITPSMQTFLDIYIQQENDRTLLDLYHNASEKDRAMVDWILGLRPPSDEVPSVKNDKK